ncbi:MAG: hypothetical protein DMF86_23425 [Acidobacteria bacterium]|nr:MAG: hypothetical protein DMF86_23425 [Acidobacteriota bacterium]
MTSLRTRLAIGALFWSIGLLSATTILITLHPELAYPVSRVHQHGVIAALIAIGAMVAGLGLVRAALAPLERMRRRLGDVQNGSERRLDGTYPAEVQPLVDDLNALLEHRDRAVRRAIAKAGDLAHGLKTPLAVLSHEAESAETAGQPELAAAVREQLERMRRHVEYHLAHARAAASGASSGARCSVAVSADGLSRTMLRLHAERGLTIDVRVPGDHDVRCQREDLDEMLGNLLDNACKWARSRVTLSSSPDGGGIAVVVDDDGPGIDPALHDAVLQRGVRADEAAPGSGLGLAIVRDLAEVYGGSIALDRSPMGGLRARLHLPRA